MRKCSADALGDGIKRSGLHSYRMGSRVSRGDYRFLVCSPHLQKMTEYWPLYELIKRFEGLRLKAYLCPAGVWTCGYGSTGQDVNQNTTWTLKQAESRMINDCDKFINAARKLCPDADDVQLCAIASFAYNVGIGALKSSTFRRVFNRGDIEGAKKQLLRWNRAGGKVLKGLTARRMAEAELL